MPYQMTLLVAQPLHICTCFSSNSQMILLAIYTQYHYNAHHMQIYVPLHLYDNLHKDIACLHTSKK